MTRAAGSTPSPYQILPLTDATIATCAQPPTRRVHCISSAGLLPRIVVAVGGSHRKRVSIEVRQGLAVANCTRSAPPPAAPARTFALGSSQVPQ